MKIVSLVGARPQFVKEALINEEVRKSSAWEHVLVHSGQHYDMNMSDVFFSELGIPAPQYHLGIGSGSHAHGTATALMKMEEVLLKEKPDGLIIYGDTNTTLAGALAAVKIGIPIIHVEAGIRQLPLSMPEEINRRLTDHSAMVSQGMLCCCSQTAADNLRKEGIVERVFVVGDVMYDLFLRAQKTFGIEAALKKFGVCESGFIVATIHRDFNVDFVDILHPLLSGIKAIAKTNGLSVLFPLHPRTRKMMKQFGLMDVFAETELTEPMGYHELMSLVGASAFVVTDSGGLQKEAYYAGKRAIVVMPDTGWREISDSGWNILVRPTEESLREAGERIARECSYPGSLYGDGDAARNIVRAIRSTFGKGPVA